MCVCVCVRRLGTCQVALAPFGAERKLKTSWLCFGPTAAVDVVALADGAIVGQVLLFLILFSIVRVGMYVCM